MINRRSFLKMLGAGTGAAVTTVAAPQVLAKPKMESDYFIREMKPDNQGELGRVYSHSIDFAATALVPDPTRMVHLERKDLLHHWYATTEVMHPIIEEADPDVLEIVVTKADYFSNDKLIQLLNDINIAINKNPNIQEIKVIEA